jgi:radical SAM superfamily enzyme with C-terminal helix-hairpin-helix motif
MRGIKVMMKEIITVLYRLEIENFYSIRQRQILDLRVADNVPDAPGRLDSIYPGARERAPRVVAIFLNQCLHAT